MRCFADPYSFDLAAFTSLNTYKMHCVRGFSFIFFSSSFSFPSLHFLVHNILFFLALSLLNAAASLLFFLFLAIVCKCFDKSDAVENDLSQYSVSNAIRTLVFARKNPYNPYNTHLASVAFTHINAAFNNNNNNRKNQVHISL